jgi:hypothetical protein
MGPGNYPFDCDIPKSASIGAVKPLSLRDKAERIADRLEAVATAVARLDHALTGCGQADGSCAPVPSFASLSFQLDRSDELSRELLGRLEQLMSIAGAEPMNMGKGLTTSLR